MTRASEVAVCDLRRSASVICLCLLPLPLPSGKLNGKFWGPGTPKDYGPHALRFASPPSNSIDTIMDCFGGVRPISLSVVFRRWSRHGRFMMTTITTVRRNTRSPYNYGSVGPGTLTINLWEPRNGVSVLSLLLYTVLCCVYLLWAVGSAGDESSVRSSVASQQSSKCN